ncbi:MAG: minor capsid protein [Lachnospiraceae bacterium]|nr:minor capsid protein [Lachnospiraceae bacterium]
MNEYSITKALIRIEDELIRSMIRNFDRHRADETKEGMNWTMWQAEQLKALEDYKRRNLKQYNGLFGHINSEISKMIRIARASGNADQEESILKAIQKGYKITKEYWKAGKGKDASISGEFFKINDRKLNALIKATVSDMEKAEHAVLRRANDQYRKIIFNAQVYANTGAGTYEKAVDMATRDFLKAGIQCVQYKNGSMHKLSEYASMAIKTANKRAYLIGEGEKREEWGIHTVIVNKRGNACPLCMPFCGKILIDDVYGNGSKKDGDYPLLSAAMAAGLYHPRCRDIHTTYFPGISTPPEKPNKEDMEKAKEDYINEQKQNYCKNMAEKCTRVSENSLDEENKRVYKERAKQWEEKEKLYQKDAGEVNLDIEEEAALIRYISPDAYTLNDKLRRGIDLTEFEKEWIMNLDKALDKMPEYEGIVYRSVADYGIEDVEEFIKSHVVGREKSFPSYISSSLSVYDESFPIQYVIKSKNGRNISQYNTKEKEILFKHNSVFLITKIKGHTIWMEEI